MVIQSRADRRQREGEVGAGEGAEGGGKDYLNIPVMRGLPTAGSPRVEELHWGRRLSPISSSPPYPDGARGILVRAIIRGTPPGDPDPARVERDTSRDRRTEERDHSTRSAVIRGRANSRARESARACTTA